MKNPSLLPYLNSTAGFHLDFLDITAGPDEPARGYYPFRILDDSDPVARLIQANLCADSGEIVKRLFVLVQKDRYLLPRDSLSTTANPDIDEAWRKAGSFYRTQGAGGSAVALAAPAGEENGQTEPFQPLLFCRLKTVFFHPVCPQCGLPLELCTDDERLTNAGLALFSRSFARYLSCNSDGCGGQSDFYVYERVPGDSSRIKDWCDLIREYSILPESENGFPGFPCIRCAEKQECFASASPMKALGRIIPFSFYPFYMLVFDAMTVDALHFSSLLSGAPEGQVAMQLRAEQAYGQADWLENHKSLKSRGFFFLPEDPRLFAEVLYLKLSLLSEIVRVMPDEGFPSEPGFRLSLDRIWVKAQEQNSLLPSLWTFTVHPLDIFRSFSGSGRASKLIARSDLYYLAIIWFSVLVVNESRSAGDISHEIRESIINDALSTDFPSDRAQGQKYCFGVFLPSDIFWNQSENRAVVSGKTYPGYWQRAMDLGKSLMAAVVEDGRSWSREEFLKEVDILRTEIHNEMFSPAPASDQHAGAAQVDDETVRDALNDIITGWHLRAEKEQSPRVPVSDAAPSPFVENIDDGEESLETIIIGPAHTEAAAGPAAGPARDELAETVIISASKPPAKPPEEELEETVIIGAGRNIPVSQGVTDEPKRDEAPSRTGPDEMEETVIISSRGAKEMFAPSKQDKGLGDQLLEETVIISRRADAGEFQAPEVPKKEPAKPVEDDLEATLIITRPKPGTAEKG